MTDLEHFILVNHKEVYGGALVGCRLWGHTESDTTEATYQQQQQYSIKKFKFLKQSIFWI